MLNSYLALLFNVFIIIQTMIKLYNSRKRQIDLSPREVFKRKKIILINLKIICILNLILFYFWLIFDTFIFILKYSIF